MNFRAATLENLQAARFKKCLEESAIPLPIVVQNWIRGDPLIHFTVVPIR
jgi:hypothetical protein